MSRRIFSSDTNPICKSFRSYSLSFKEITTTRTFFLCSPHPSLSFLLKRPKKKKEPLCVKKKSATNTLNIPSLLLCWCWLLSCSHCCLTFYRVLFFCWKERKRRNSQLNNLFPLGQIRKFANLRRISGK